MLLTAGERISMAAAGHGDRRPRPRGPLVHRQPGRRHHRLRPRHGPDHRRHAGPHPRRRSTRARSRSSPASRASRRTPRTSPRSAAAARTPRRSRSPPRSAPTSARSTPTSTASSPPTRASSPSARRLDAHHLRGDARDGGRRRQGAAPALRRVRAPLRAAHPRALVVQPRARAPTSSPWQPTQKETTWSRPSSRGSPTTAARRKVTVVGVPDKPGEAAAIFRARRRRRDQHRHDRAERLGRGDRPHRHLLHAAEDRRRDGARRRCDDVPGRDRLRVARSTTTRSARCRWSVPRCARTPGSRRRSSPRSPTPASTSR